MSTLSFSAVACLALPAFAMPGDVVAEVESLLGSPVAQLPINDPILQKALEILQDSAPRKEYLFKNNKPDGPIGRAPHRDVDRRLILGGPEVIPL